MKKLHKLFWLLVIGLLLIASGRCWYSFVTEDYVNLFPALVFSALVLLCVALWKDIK